MTNLFMCQKQTDNPKWLKLSTYITDMCTIHSRKQTYIYNWSLQPFRQDYGLASHTTLVVCVKFVLQCSLTSTRNDRFIYSQSFCQKSAEKKSPKKYFSYFIFDDWPGIRTQAFASNKPTHYRLDHGDFQQLLVSQLFAILLTAFL